MVLPTCNILTGNQCAPRPTGWRTADVKHTVHSTYFIQCHHKSTLLAFCPCPLTENVSVSDSACKHNVNKHETPDISKFFFLFSFLFFFANRANFSKSFLSLSRLRNVFCSQRGTVLQRKQRRFSTLGWVLMAATLNYTLSRSRLLAASW